MSNLEETLIHQLALVGLPAPTREHRFHPVRRWRFDLAYPERKLAVEVEGGTWGKSRHTTGAGYEKDCEKYNAAVLAGWRVLRVTGDMVRDGRAVNLVEVAWGG
jgi:very-short-patch-repair endonuclease